MRRRLEVVALPAAPAVRDAVNAWRDVLDVTLRAEVGPVLGLLRRREVVAVRAATSVVEGIHSPPDAELRVNCCGRERCEISKREGFGRCVLQAVALQSARTSVASAAAYSSVRADAAPPAGFSSANHM